MSPADPAAFTCPVPDTRPSTVQLAHGGGGRMSAELVASIFLPALGNAALEPLHDGATLTLPPGRVAFSTDSFVVSPLFFPGGDIGSLAVHGTVNDLAMCGARPLHLSAGFILEEGLALETLRQIAVSMGEAARAAGVTVVTGDTKVVDRGKADGVFINTSGVGVIPADVDISPRRAVPGDVILVSGEIAVHGIAIISVRNGLEFGTTLRSDSAALFPLVDAALAVAGRDVHVLRDPTRGGVASALNEIAVSAGVGMELEERAIPVSEQVRGACELLGFDPLYVANEGKCLAIVAREKADAVLAAWRAHPLGACAAILGEVVAAPRGGHAVRRAIAAYLLRAGHTRMVRSAP